MMDVRKILVPVDFSKHSARALQEAIGFAKVFGASLELLHCYSLNPGAISPYGLVLSHDYDREFREAAELKLAEWKDKVAAESVPVETILTPIYPSEGIARATKENGADLIVMGTRGLTGLAHVVMGSVAEDRNRNSGSSTHAWGLGSRLRRLTLSWSGAARRLD